MVLKHADPTHAIAMKPLVLSKLRHLLKQSRPSWRRPLGRQIFAERPESTKCLIFVNALSKKLRDASIIDERWRILMKNTYLSALLVAVGMIWIPTIGYCQDGGQGKYWYLSYCASCHGTSGKGDGSVARALTQKPADLTALSSSNGGVFPTARVTETIDGRREVWAHGSRDMPVWGKAARFAPGMVRARIRAIIDYVAALQSK